MEEDLLSIAMRQLLQKFLHIVRGDEQVLNAFCESIWVLGNHQQPVLCVPIAHESIPVQVFLIFTFLDAADLLERKKQTIVNVTGNEMDPNPLVGDDVGCWCPEELCVPIEERKPNDHQKDLPET